MMSGRLSGIFVWWSWRGGRTTTRGRGSLCPPRCIQITTIIMIHRSLSSFPPPLLAWPPFQLLFPSPTDLQSRQLSSLKYFSFFSIFKMLELETELSQAFMKFPSLHRRKFPLAMNVFGPYLLLPILPKSQWLYPVFF